MGALHPSVSVLLARTKKHLPEAVWSRAMIGGGAIRACFDMTMASDVDLFFRSQEDFDAAVAALEADEHFDVCGGGPRAPKYGRIEGPLGTVLGPEYNLIGFRFKQTPKELAESFDFVCCGFAVNIATGEYYALPGAQFEAESSLLTINRVQPINRLVKRATHYQSKYGYSFSTGTALAEKLALCALEEGPDDFVEYE